MHISTSEIPFVRPLRGCLLVFVAATIGLSPACAGKTVPAGPDTPAAKPDQLGQIVDGPGDAGSGKSVYIRNCEPCHGVKGRGNGPLADLFETAPRDFTMGTFKFQSTPPGMPPTDGDLYRSIRQGLPGTAMPSWSNVLTERESWDVVQYVKTFSDVFQPDRAREPIAIPDPPADRTKLPDGRATFETYGCTTCHGTAGYGNGPRARGLSDAKNRPISPRNFAEDRFRGGRELADIYRTITTGLDGTPMAPFGMGMSEEERWAIAYYIRSLRQEAGAGKWLFRYETIDSFTE